MQLLHYGFIDFRTFRCVVYECISNGVTLDILYIGFFYDGHVNMNYEMILLRSYIGVFFIRLLFSYWSVIYYRKF